MVAKPEDRSSRVLYLAAIAVLLAGPLVAPRLDPRWIFPISLGWLAIAIATVATALVWSRRRAGWIAPIALVAVLGALAAVVGTDWDGATGTRLPCRRNWGWLPSWLLRSSPTESVSFDLGDQRVKICYGSPRVRGRKAIGGSLVPYGQLWRTGANEPTTIRTSGSLQIAGIRIDGKASLYTVPGPETWEIVLNRSTSQWGIESAYRGGVAEAEIGRTVVASDTTPGHQEAFAITVEPGADSASAVLVLSWERTVVRIPVVSGGR